MVSNPASRYGKFLPFWHIQKVFRRIDTFGTSLPAFNIQGDSKLNTALGGVFTVCIFMCTIAYTVIKSIHLASGHNPVINIYTETNYYSSTDKVNLSETGFRLAFSVEGFIDQIAKTDTSYVKWFVRLTGTTDGEEFEKVLSYHKCTDDDWKDFS